MPGCGTMGIAITSGVIASLETRAKHPENINGPSSSASGTSTPVLTPIPRASDAAVPSKFIACVSRHETAKKLRRTFEDLGPLGEKVDIRVGENLQAVTESDVVLLW